MFGDTFQSHKNRMGDVKIDPEQVVAETDAPAGEPVEELDVRSLGPPKPLSETLERLETIDLGILVQYNDRAPQHLYPKLEDRGYRYETCEIDESTITVIWED